MSYFRIYSFFMEIIGAEIRLIQSVLSLSRIENGYSINRFKPVYKSQMR